MTKMDELLQKYGKTIEDITFEYDGLSDDELEVKFAEAFDGEGEGSSSDNDGADVPVEGENSVDNEDSIDNEEPVIDENPVIDGVDEGEASDDAVPAKKVDNTFSIGEMQYELSLGEKEYALYQLVNATYADADNTWYGVQAYESYVIMEDWCTGQCYRQNYSEDDGQFMLTGDRVQVYAVYVTAEERDELDNMRANYDDLVAFKANVDLENIRAQKLSSVSDEKYAVIKNEKAYKELVKNIDNYSLADFEKEVKLVLFDYREKHPLNQDHKVNFDLNSQPKKKAYGNLFD